MRSATSPETARPRPRRRPLGVRPALLPAFLTFAFLAFGTAGCSDGRTPLVVYSPHGPDLLGLMEKEYERLHPDVDVRWLDMGSQDVYDRVRSEAANPQADVWYGGPDTILARGAAEGLLQPYRPAWAEAVPPASRQPEDLYFGLYRTAPVLVYNSAAVPEAEAPHDWDDLLDPRWRGKILIRDPLGSGTMRTLFGSILARSLAETGTTDRGFAWLARLDAQTKEYVLNPTLMIEKLTRQEGLVTVWELTDMLWQQERKRPLAFTFPTSGTPVIDDAIGLVAKAPHPAAARAFIDWVGSPEAVRLAAEKAFRLPARSDLPAAQLPAWAQRVLAEMVPARVDWDLLAARDAEWMGRWDRQIRGRGAAGWAP
jgi:iron(III) transport system substrate-binding protein